MLLISLTTLDFIVNTMGRTLVLIQRKQYTCTFNNYNYIKQHYIIQVRGCVSFYVLHMTWTFTILPSWEEV
jgi:hypothetical protein